MSKYPFQEIEKKWQQYWSANKTFEVHRDHTKPKYYVLDMFPYPSGEGLHVGHPLGYIASDVVARYKKSCGYNVLHPMGFDAFGLPAEQYAIQTGQHPAITTKKNIARYKEQLYRIGLAYDWSREVCTSEPMYYKWTQWIFCKLFDSWYNVITNKAEPIDTLLDFLEKNGNYGLHGSCSANTPEVSPEDWKDFSQKEKEIFLSEYRLAYLSESTVNWCPGLGTVLSNEEVCDGVSERGGYPVEQKKMLQWMLRITAYARRLLKDLERLDWPESIKATQKHWIGEGDDFRLRDAVFSRQRYWGEPIPIFYKDGLPYLIDKTTLPLTLPEVKSYKPTLDGRPPLTNADNWKYEEGCPLEVNTMPGWAGSSWYFLRYMDPHNERELVCKTSQHYWQNVDLYIGGSEHATGHLIYARFWTKFLFDLGYISVDEPFQKLINQGMIQGRSSFVYRIKGTNTFVSKDLKDNYDTTALHVSIDFVQNDLLDLEAFKSWRPDLADADFILNQKNQYVCGSEVEKMSKSKHNIVSPDTIVEKYGADTLRLYTMFLGPLEMSKPWDTNGIEGCFRFLSKIWSLFHKSDGIFYIEKDSKPSKEMLQTLHRTIKKIHHAIENYSFNTAISASMVCVNELTRLDCRDKEILRDFLLVLAPFAPHICEELWQRMGNATSIVHAGQPKYEESYVADSTYEYPVSINGKVRARVEFQLSEDSDVIKTEVLTHKQISRWLRGETPKKVIVVPGKIINIVV